MIVAIRHRFLVGKHARFRHGANEQAVSAHIQILLHLERHKGVDIFRQENQSIIGMQGRPTGKLIHAAAALETKVFKDAKRSLHRQAVDIHNPGLFDNMMRIIILINRNSNPIGRAGQLSHGVDNQTVVPFAVIAGDDVKSIANLKESGKVIFVSSFIMLRQIITTKLISQSVQLFFAFFI